MEIMRGGVPHTVHKIDEMHGFAWVTSDDDPHRHFTIPWENGVSHNRIIVDDAMDFFEQNDLPTIERAKAEFEEIEDARERMIENEIDDTLYRMAEGKE